MDINAPIAMRLGITKIKVELDDLSLKYLKPDVYYDLVHKVALRKSEREQFVGAIVKEVKKHMDDAKHMAGTGVSNTLTLQNIVALKNANWSGRLVLRQPTINGYNDDIENA